ncbi:hypothetical protein OTERR_00440 [Oryzomicrobium terrae]|uniref:Lipoprotein n=1 Tax=Oryzomicrobium terrae TaxID=1735038 RepID=A0A5C1E3T2_9RHOO|nr:Sbal_3080 family lipoprotein [Oryzomicrobium terrae]QEL63520.1 hypothetical protein OTERR_00440 [Oryzomicrobium terrae]
MFHCRFVPLTAVALLASACSISTTVKPVEKPLTSLCLHYNNDVLMDGFHPELEAQIQSAGIRTQTYKGPRPADCETYVEYTASWRWDLAMFLRYAQLRVFESNRLIGEATYDARYGGGRPDKFGPTAGKLRKLTDPLFAASRVAAGLPATTVAEAE